MKEDTARQEFHGQQREALDRRHARERSELRRQARDLAAVEQRERLSFEADQRRESLPALVSSGFQRFE
jgi:hypothetical protein